MSKPSNEILQRIVAHLGYETANTEELCRERPELAPLRDLLLTVEKDAHVTEGWDASPRLFLVRRHDDSGKLSAMPVPALTKIMLDHNDRPPAALEAIAKIFETVRSVVDGESRGALVPGPAGTDAADFLQVLRLVRGVPKADLLACGKGHSFVGFGFLMEGWMVAPVPGDDYDAMMEMARQHRLHTRPDRLEMRQVHFSGRDGLLWEVSRVRNVEGFTFPRAVLVCSEGDRRISGSVPESLSRICNAIASNPVPIVRYSDD